MPTKETEKLMALFSKRLIFLMEEKNINQVELSLAIGLSRSTVNKWVTKKAIPRMGIIEKLASFFGVPRSYFLENNAEMDMIMKRSSVKGYEGTGDVNLTEALLKAILELIEKCETIEELRESVKRIMDDRECDK